MISAFGVEHGEISKGLPSGARSADTAYAVARKLANKRGRLAGKLKAQGDQLTARRWTKNGQEARNIARGWNRR